MPGAFRGVAEPPDDDHLVLSRGRAFIQSGSTMLIRRSGLDTAWRMASQHQVRNCCLSFLVILEIVKSCERLKAVVLVRLEVRHRTLEALHARTAVPLGSSVCLPVVCCREVVL